MLQLALKDAADQYTDLVWWGACVLRAEHSLPKDKQTNFSIFVAKQFE
jgi:hypothetical protein